MTKTLRLVLGDQLNIHHSWYQNRDEGVCYLLMEMRQETDYVQHHRQKVLAFFGAMRRFATALRQRGHRVHYLALNDAENRHSLTQNLEALIARGDYTRVEYQGPDEYRLDEQLRVWAKAQRVAVVAIDTEHFLTSRTYLKEFFAGKKTYRMESFYRHMRQRHGVLMDGEEPVSGRWNYDAENRNKLPQDAEVPPPLTFRHDLEELDTMLEAEGVKTLGSAPADRFPWPLDRGEAVQVLEYFVEQLLPSFGTYQDAMHTDEVYLYHSRLSFALNTKMLHPREVIARVEEVWRHRPERVSLAQAEGFIRQILGWREYMRGVYWAHMPDYAHKNQLNHQRTLPRWYWTGHTHMNCLKQAIGQSLDHAYAHHIQRLMVTGNFALLAGVDPREVDAWYLGIYIDAIEWVEMPNTRGMSQFADGGLVGTKPYVSSANYIHKMSNYCGSCAYQHKKKHGEGACPFNSLYWNFYERHRDTFENNPRIGMAYRTWDRMEAAEREKILQQAADYLDRLDDL